MAKIVDNFWTQKTTLSDGDSVRSEQPSNFDREALKAEFKSRFLNSYAIEVTNDMTEITEQTVMATIKLSPIAAVIYGGLALSGGIGLAAVAAGAIAVRASFFAIPRSQRALEGAAERFVAMEKLEASAIPSAVDKWMNAHIEDIAHYINRLDRREHELRLRAKIIQRLEKGFDRKNLSVAEQELLDRYDSKKFKTRAENHFSLPAHVAILGNWHSTKLQNALRKDIKRLAGDEAKIVRQTFLPMRSAAAHKKAVEERCP